MGFKNFVYRLINKTIDFFFLKKIKVIRAKTFKKYVLYDDIKNLIYTPISKVYIEKIIFVDCGFECLYDLHLEVGNELSDYIKIEKFDWTKVEKILNYKIIVTSSELRFLKNVSKKNQKVVCLWHGIGAFKKVGKYNNLLKTKKSQDSFESFFDYLVVSSNNIRKIYADSFNLDESQVLSFGLPHSVKYLDKNVISKKREEFYKKYPFLRDKKIYGFFPTFQDTKLGTYWNIDFIKLSKLLKGDEIILYKLHPSIPKKNTNFQEIKNKILNFSQYEDLMISCDFQSILTDYSSSFFEAMMLDFNLCFYRNYFVENERNLYIKYESLPGTIIDESIIENEQEIENQIIEALRNKIKKDNYYDFYRYNVSSCALETNSRIKNFLTKLLMEK